MKDLLKQEKGVSLISLVIAILILGIITTMLLYNSKDSKQVKELTNMYSDIENLTDKISSYYSKYGNIPVLTNYDLSEVKTIKIWNDLDNSNNTNNPKGKNDSDKFLIIDLKALENLTLNYGRDYEKLSDIDTLDNADIYIINENSHNIFYLKGIIIDGKTYYTNQDKDNKQVDLRYVDGVKVPDGYYYKGKDKDGNITISDSQLDIGNVYIWINLEQKINKEDLTNITIAGQDLDGNLQNEDDFIYSANSYKGYYKNKNGTNVIYLSLNESIESAWSPLYLTEAIYKDENGDTAYIPAGFKVSKLPTMNKIKNGLVIKDASTNEDDTQTETNGNQYVWIEVPKSIYTNTEYNEGVSPTSSKDYNKIETIMKNYVADYREDGYEDTWYDGCGIADKETYNSMYQTMLSNVYQNEGFWISRYEIGDSTATQSNKQRVNGSGMGGLAVSKQDQIPYNYVTNSEAQRLAHQMSPGISNKTSSLLFGIQWDLVCKYIEVNGDWDTSSNIASYYINENSSSWGNYLDSEFNITSRNAKELKNNVWAKIENGEEKSASSTALLSTGASRMNSILNIYNFAGNEREFTLEKNNDPYQPCTFRGGVFTNPGASDPASIRYYDGISSSDDGISFRSTIY